MNVLLRYLSLVSLVLLSGCLSTPSEQIAHITSENGRELGLGVTGSVFNVSFPNRALDSTPENPIALTNWFYVPAACEIAGECEGETEVRGECVQDRNISHLNFVRNLSGKEQGTAVWSQVESSGQFPNTSTALRQLREKYASQTDNIELLISFGSMTLGTTVVVSDETGETSQVNDIKLFEPGSNTAFAGFNSVVGRYKPIDASTPIQFLCPTAMPEFSFLAFYPDLVLGDPCQLNTASAYP